MSCAVSPAIAAGGPPQAGAPSVDERYRRAETYLSAGKLVFDNGRLARFTRDGKGVIFHSGVPGHGEYRVLDLAVGTASVVADDARLAASLAAATGRNAGEIFRDEPTDLDYAQSTRTFSFAWQGNWQVTDGKLARLADPGPDDPGLSPDGATRIVARNFNLVAVDVHSGREVALTSDGTADRPYGREIVPLATIIAQNDENPAMPVSLAWSPDSRAILTWRLDTRNVARLSLTEQNPPGSLYPRSFRYVYPTAGAAILPRADRLVIDVASALRTGRAAIVPVRMPTEEILYPAAPDMGWVGGTGRAQWVERGYGKLEVYAIDPKSGAARVVARESVKPLVAITVTTLQSAPQLGGELAISERSGWAQLYLVKPDDPDGGRPITQGRWEVLSVDRVDAAAGSILLTGIGREPDRNPYWKQLYRVGLDGGAPVLLTPEPLDHEISLSNDGRFAIDRMSSPATPTRTVVRDLADGRILHNLADADARGLLAGGYTPPEPFQGLAADGKTPLYGLIYRPAHFDPSRRYPVADEVYTGPTMHQVPGSWDEAIQSSASSVAQLGMVVVMIDGTGTSQRGQAFRQPAYRNLGEVGLDDHIAMIRQMAARYPYIDIARAGVYGCSAGGYDAARFILRRPDFFKVSVASSGNHDERLDKAWWPEATMGNADAATWERSSNMTVAGQLKGKLLLVHGDLDDNVPVTETFRLAKALIDAGRDVDVVILPNQRHCAWTPYFWRKFRDYFTRNLLDEAPPAGAAIETDPLSSAK